MSDPLQPLDALPVSASALAAQVPLAAAALARGSAARLAARGGLFDEVLALGPVRLDWRLGIVRQGTRRLFFFLRRAGPERTLLDARVRLEFAPWDTEGAPAVSAEPQAQYHFVVPRFVTLTPDDESWERAWGGPAPAARDRLLIHTAGAAPGTLAVVGRDRFREARYRFTPAAGGAAPVAFDARAWPAAPAIGMLHAMAQWARDRRRGDAAVVAGLDREGRHAVSHRVIAALVQAHRGAAAAVRRRPADLDPVVAELLADYGLDAFSARVVLRLDAEGELVTDDSEDTFALEMRIALERRPAGVVARIEAGPADFLVSGALHREIVTAFAGEGRHLARIARALRGQVANIGASAVAAFVRQHAEGAPVFRLRRRGGRGPDREMLVVEGEMGGQTVWLAAAFDIEVDAGDPRPRVRLDAGSVAVVLARAGGIAGAPLGGESAEYLRRFVAAQHDWLGAIL